MAFEDEVNSVDIFSSNEKFESSESNNGVFYNFCVSPTSLDLDPYWFFLKYDPNFGLVPNNDYSIVVKDNLDNTTDFNINKDPIKEEVRILAQKTPMMVQGWGYDVCGIAVPQNSPDERFFHPNTPVNRKLWKTGPLDIRWDDERKVWVGGAEFIEGLMVTGLGAGDPNNPSYGSGQIYRSDLASVGTTWKYDKYVIAPNPDPLLAIRPDPLGSVPQNQQIGEFNELVRIYNRNPGLSLNAGDYFAATKINYEWRIVGAGGGGSCIVGKFKRVNCSATAADKTIMPEPNLYSDNGQLILDFGNIPAGMSIYYVMLNNFEDIIPSESAGGQLVPSDGKLLIPPVGGVPYFISLVAFENCKFSSNVFDLKIYGTSYDIFYVRFLDKLFDCPNSNDCFGTVTDDITGSTYYATHPFKFIKHDVRVVACASNLTITCNDGNGNPTTYPSYVITEVDDCANSGTGESRE
jgi:hypothetical protein